MTPATGPAASAEELAARPFVSCVILAAGASTRLGRRKQLLELGGRAVLGHVLAAAAGSGADEVILVLGHATEEILAAVPPPEGVRVVVNPDHAAGQATSLLAGLRAASPRAAAALVLLGDQPTVRREAIAAVVEAFRREPERADVIQAAYAGRPAHPTVLARRIWVDLAELRGDDGARSWIDAHPHRRALVEVGGDPPEDLDTEEDYRRLRTAVDGAGDGAGDDRHRGGE